MSYAVCLLGTAHGCQRAVLPGSDEPIVVVPNHPGETLPPGTLRSILEQAGLSIEAFRTLL